MQVSLTHSPSLESHVVGNRFRELFQSEMESLHADHLSTNEMCANMRICYEKVAGECLPKVSRRVRKPWISNITLQLISDRDVAKVQHNHELEKHLTKSIKFAVKTDRTLNNMLAKGDWKEIRKLRKGFCPKQGRLKDGQEVVENTLRADVLAKHFETVQWCNRFTTGASCDRLGPPLPVSQDDITVEEVISAAKTLKTGRQRGNTTCLQNFGKQFASKTLYVVSGPFACAIRCGAVDMFRTTGMKQWCRQFSKKETRHLVKIIARSHYWQSATSCSLQFCFAD